MIDTMNRSKSVTFPPGMKDDLQNHSLQINFSNHNLFLHNMEELKISSNYFLVLSIRFSGERSSSKRKESINSKQVDIICVYDSDAAVNSLC